MTDQSDPHLFPPERGFPESEFAERTQRMQTAMRALEVDGLLLTTEAEIRYFSGFHTQFFESPTRPWFLVVPANGQPIALIPEIGASGMAATWIEDIRTWPSPRPEDDGVSLLANTLKELPQRFGRVGVPMGQETLLRMPVTDYRSLADKVRPIEFIDAAGPMHQLRFIKSKREIEKIRYVCQLTSAAFTDLPSAIQTGETERDICRSLRIDLLQRGADSCPYIVAGSGPGGYDSIIMGPTDRIPSSGDVLIIDTGTTFDGYFCDFDRNFAFESLSDPSRKAHEVVHRATDAGFAAARPGATTTDVWCAMWSVLEAGGALGNSVGRMGHGLGMQLTEWPSVRAGDDTPLAPGAILTLEPGMTFAPGQQLVHEENIVITEEGAEYLTVRAPLEMPVVKD
jgi:Xaa-Pro dipeptidase